MDGTRINKFLSEAGYCSRREADRLIAARRVTIDGGEAHTGSRVTAGQQVLVDGVPVGKDAAEPILLIVNKPLGIVCTCDTREANNIVDFLHYPKRIYPIGRLDKDSHGLLLMTNVGRLHNEITRAAGGHEKEYVVQVDRRVSAEFVRRMEQGIYLPELSCTTAPAKVKKLSEKTFSIVLTQGKNRQIRRMCKACSYRVKDLMRVREMNFTLEGIAEGDYREATDAEWQVLWKEIGP